MIRSRRRRAAARSLVLLRLVQACTSCGRLEMISVWLLVLKLLVGTPMFVFVFFLPCCILQTETPTVARLHLEIVYLEMQCAEQNRFHVSKPMVLCVALYDCVCLLWLSLLLLSWKQSCKSGISVKLEPTGTQRDLHIWMNDRQTFISGPVEQSRWRHSFKSLLLLLLLFN